MKKLKQKSNARLDESLGMRKGAEKLFKESLKDRRDESKAMEKKAKGQAYAAVRAMDKKAKAKKK